MEIEECEHSWSHAGLVPIPDKDKGNILVIVMYCHKCAEVESKLVPPPHISQIVTAKAVPEVILR